MTVVTLVRATPRWAFHLPVAALAGWLVVSASLPGGGFFSFYVAGLGLCGAALMWLVKLVDARP